MRSHSLLSRRELASGGAPESLRSVLPLHNSPPPRAPSTDWRIEYRNARTPLEGQATDDTRVGSLASWHHRAESPPDRLATAPSGALAMEGRAADAYRGERSSWQAAAEPGRAGPESEGGGSGGTRHAEIPSQPKALSQVQTHDGSVVGPWSARFQDRREQASTATGGGRTRPSMSVPGMPPTQPGSIAFAPQVGTERPGTFGTAGSSRPADPLDPDELAARRAEVIKNAESDYRQQLAAITEQVKALPVPDGQVRLIVEAEGQLRQIRDDRVARSDISGLKPESTEPRRRIEGFDPPSSSPS
jgi:hypothetical protein